MVRAPPIEFNSTSHACPLPAHGQEASTLRGQKWFWNHVQPLLQQGMAESSGGPARGTRFIRPERWPHVTLQQGFREPPSQSFEGGFARRTPAGAACLCVCGGSAFPTDR